MAGDFTTDNADNNALCPNGFYATPTAPTRRVHGAAIFPERFSRTARSIPVNNSSAPNSGQKIPSQFIDPGAAALAKIWPKANANSATTPGG